MSVTTKHLSACVAVVAVLGCVGCESAADRPTGDWEVTEWLIDTDDGPTNFEPNVGWRFTFADDVLTVTEHDGPVTEYQVTDYDVPEVADGRGMTIVSALDYDEDGEPDVHFTRHTLFRFDGEDLVLAYGGMDTSVSLDTGEVDSRAATPTEFRPTRKVSLLRLRRTDGAGR